MYSKILLAVDGSDNNRTAAHEAVDIAKAMNAELTAVYVLADMEPAPNAFGADASLSTKQAIAEKSSKDALDFITVIAKDNGVELKTLILHGNPGKEIVKISKDYDLVVCGSLGLTGISKMLMGSVSSTIVKYSDCPVLISRYKA